MKKIITLLLILNSAFCSRWFGINSAFAQAPQAIPYQAVARDLSGNPITNHNISLRFSIHDSIPGGVVVYKETQPATTNLLGLFTSNIGQGTVVSGTFAAINWAKSFKYLQVELDTAGGSNYANMGTEQMLSVPYAFYSRSSSGGWGLSGNAGTDSLNFIGTIDDVPFNIKVNNHNAGKVGRSKRVVTLGYAAGDSLSSGADNVFIGDSAGFRVLTEGKNTFVGSGAGRYNGGLTDLFGNILGNSNSFFGNHSGYSNTGGEANSFFGANSGYSNNVGTVNSFFGSHSGYKNKSGDYNSFFGHESGTNNISGERNSFFGTYSGLNNIGNFNSFFGQYAGGGNTTGFGNSFFGRNSGSGNTTGYYNTFVGTDAGGASGTQINSTAIGYDAVVNASDKVRIGNTNITLIEGQVAFSNPSDGRFKNNITEEVKGLDFIMRLRPVVYNFDTKKFDEFLHSGDKKDRLKDIDYGPSTAIRQSGFIAQEVETALKESGYDFNGLHIPVNDHDNYSLAYSQFTVPLVKAVQELNSKNEMLLKENDTLKNMLTSIEQKMQALESKVNAIVPFTANK